MKFEDLEFPQYKCHKVVGALKIDDMQIDDTKVAFMLSNFNTVELPVAHYPQLSKSEIGGYLVLYDNEYLSYSPAKAFEDGYKLLEPIKDDDAIPIGEML